MEARATLINYSNPLGMQSKQLALNGSKESKGEVLFGDTFRKVTNVFSPKILRNANKVIDIDSDLFTDPKEIKSKEISGFMDSKIVNVKNAFYLRNNGQVNFQYGLSEDLKNIRFDGNCKIENYEDLRKNIEKHTSSPELVELIADGLQSMAKNANWANQTVSFPLIGIIRYPITNEQDLSGMPWHRDAIGDTTMTVLMNPKPNESYVGGGLRTAEIDDSKCPIINKYNLFELPHKEETEQLHQYEQNTGFLFTNCKKLLHQAQEAEILTEGSTQTMVEKRLFTIFADTYKPIPLTIGFS